MKLCNKIIKKAALCPPNIPEILVAARMPAFILLVGLFVVFEEGVRRHGGLPHAPQQRSVVCLHVVKKLRGVTKMDCVDR